MFLRASSTKLHIFKINKAHSEDLYINGSNNPVVVAVSFANSFCKIFKSGIDTTRPESLCNSSDCEISDNVICSDIFPMISVETVEKWLRKLKTGQVDETG